METKPNEANEGKWIEIKEPIGACELCTHQTECNIIKRHIAKCYAAKYRFRCPIEVFALGDATNGT